ncbi:hypothetical protein JCM18237_14700 [Halorubrum luteum]
MTTVYVTAPRDAAAELAETLVERRIAACVNMVECDSVYRWESDVIADSETILFVKTTDEVYEDLVAAVTELHPYDVPCIERFDETDVFEPFETWVGDSVTPGTGADDIGRDDVDPDVGHDDREG